MLAADERNGGMIVVTVVVMRVVTLVGLVVGRGVDVVGGVGFLGVVVIGGADEVVRPVVVILGVVEGS